VGRIITFTTDFGLEDPFIGVMKGVVLDICPDARLIDLSHAIPPQDLLRAALTLEAAVPYFPDQSIHLAVVDPGVGTDRAAVAIDTGKFVLVGPDNGVFTLVLARYPRVDAVRLTEERFFRHPVSPTFHGRDIFAPVAAHIANGVPLSELGAPVEDLVRLDLPTARIEGDTLIGHVLTADRFGNLMTDVSVEILRQFGAPERYLRIRVGAEEIVGVSRTYGDATERTPVAYIGSSGRLEIGIRNGNAAQTLGAKRGARVTVTYASSGGSV
jgi:S-adenosylmethionine hydrolase